MSQGIFPLSCTQSGTQFTSALNAILEGIDSTNSGDTAPTTNLVEGKMWLDTSNAELPVLKIFDASINSGMGGFIVLGENGDVFRTRRIYKNASTTPADPTNSDTVLDGTLATTTTSTAGWGLVQETPGSADNTYTSVGTFRQSQGTGNFTIQGTWEAVSQLSGDTGTTGVRGPVIGFYVPMVTRVDATTFTSVLANFNPTSLVSGDQIITTGTVQNYLDASFSQHFFGNLGAPAVEGEYGVFYNSTDATQNIIASYDASSGHWTTSSKQIAGNLIVDGSITADSIDVNAITSKIVRSGKTGLNDDTSGFFLDSGGDFVIGGDIDHQLKWDGTTGVLTIPAATISGTLTASQIATNAITADKIEAGSINAGKIEAGSITATELSSLTLTTDKKITVGNIDVGSVTELSAATVTTDPGNKTISVDSTADFTDTGTLLIGGSERFTYTSKTATTFVSTVDTIQTIKDIDSEVLKYTVNSGVGVSLEGEGRFAVGSVGNSMTFDGDILTISGVELDANDLANLGALDGKVSASLQTYADETAYAAGDVVIDTAKKIFRVKLGQEVADTNTTDPVEGAVWEEISKDTNDNTTYSLTNETVTGGVKLTLDGSAGTDTTQEFIGGDNVTVTRTDEDTITIASTDSNDNTTYSLTNETVTGGVKLTLDGSAGTDTTQEFIGGDNVTVTRTDEDTITIASTDSNDNTTYSLTNETVTGGVKLTLDGSAGTDTTQEFIGGDNVTVTRTDEDTITIASTDSNDNTTYSLTNETVTGGVKLTLDGSAGTDTTQEFIGGDNVTVTRTDEDTITIASTDTDTNTTYDAGTSLELNDTTFKVSDGGISATQLADSVVNLDKIAVEQMKGLVFDLKFTDRSDSTPENIGDMFTATTVGGTTRLDSGDWNTVKSVRLGVKDTDGLFIGNVMDNFIATKSYIKLDDGAGNEATLKVTSITLSGITGMDNDREGYFILNTNEDALGPEGAFVQDAAYTVSLQAKTDAVVDGDLIVSGSINAASVNADSGLFGTLAATTATIGSLDVDFIDATTVITKELFSAKIEAGAISADRLVVDGDITILKPAAGVDHDIQAWSDDGERSWNTTVGAISDSGLDDSDTFEYSGSDAEGFYLGQTSEGPRFFIGSGSGIDSNWVKWNGTSLVATPGGIKQQSSISWYATYEPNDGLNSQWLFKTNTPIPDADDRSILDATGESNIMSNSVKQIILNTTTNFITDDIDETLNTDLFANVVNGTSIRYTRTDKPGETANILVNDIKRVDSAGAIGTTTGTHIYYWLDVTVTNTGDTPTANTVNGVLGSSSRLEFVSVVQDGVDLGDIANITTDNTSVKIGYGTNETKGKHGVTSLGFRATANGTYSTAIGNTTEALGQGSIAIGLAAIASARSSIRIGDSFFESGADGTRSIAIGTTTTASSRNAIAIGYNTTATENNDIAIGYNATADGEDSIAIGETANANGTDSTAIGHDAKADGLNSMALGNGATLAADPLFHIYEAQLDNSGIINGAARWRMRSNTSTAIANDATGAASLFSSEIRQIFICSQGAVSLTNSDNDTGAADKLVLMRDVSSGDTFVLTLPAAVSGLSGTNSITITLDADPSYETFTSTTDPGNVVNNGVWRLQFTLTDAQIISAFGIDSFFVNTAFNMGVSFGFGEGAVDNRISLGNGDITSLNCNAQTISSLSDERDKTDITDLSETDGLPFINKLKPRTYYWDRREWYDGQAPDGTKKMSYDKDLPNSGKRMGFIAQETEVAMEGLECISESNLVTGTIDKKQMALAELITPMVKAIQQLSDENEDLKARLDALENP